jgi:hypothetical protein
MPEKGITLDMSLFFGTEEQKKQFCDDLLRVLKLRGGVKLINHGIPDEDIKGLFDMVRDFGLSFSAIRMLILLDSQILCLASRGENENQTSSPGQPQPRVQLRWPGERRQYQRIRQGQARRRHTRHQG